MPNAWSDFLRHGDLQRNGMQDSAVRERLDGIAGIATRLLGASSALISLTTDETDIVVGRAGLEIDDGPNEGSPGSLVTDNAACTVVNDLRNDARFAEHPLVTDAPYIRFFAGYPLLDHNGARLGVLCAMDSAPHGPLRADQIDDLRTLAWMATDCLEQWRTAQQQDHGMVLRFETLADALPQLVWSTPADGLSDYFSQQWCRFTGAPASASYGTGWLNFVHIEDVPAATQAWRRAVLTGEPYTIEFRLLNADGNYRWMLVRGLPVTDKTGRITRWVGTCTDIDERVRNGDMLEFMSRELSHRIKNMFAVVQGLISMALRKHPAMNQVSQSLQSRIVALGRAHDLVRPRISDGTIWRSQTTLRDLIRILTTPYTQDDSSRLEILGDDAVVNELATTPLALFFHEMTINSARFGALSLPQGRLRIVVTVRDDVTIDWKETGGPAIAMPPTPAFGLSLTKLSIERQLGGSLAMDWQSDGLHAFAHIPLHQLAAE